jgi:hypothetical protein
MSIGRNLIFIQNWSVKTEATKEKWNTWLWARVRKDDSCRLGRFLILSDSLSSLMAMRSRRITCRTHPWYYESKQIYKNLQQLNYDVKLKWISSHVGISGNEVADVSREWHRSRTNDDRQWPQDCAKQAILHSKGNMYGGQEILVDLLIQCDLWFRSNHGLMDRRRRVVLWQQYQELWLVIWI